MARRRQVEPPDDLNLVPVMNLVSVLIPFLLMAAEFVSLAAIHSTLPTIGPPQPDPQEPDQAPLNLTVAIGVEGLEVQGAAAALGEEGGEGATSMPCRGGGRCGDVDAYDWQGLTRLLARVKDARPDEESVILVPDERVQYEVLVRAMDVCREDRSGAAASGAPRALFPRVVIAGGAIN